MTNHPCLPRCFRGFTYSGEPRPNTIRGGCGNNCLGSFEAAAYWAALRASAGVVLTNASLRRYPVDLDSGVFGLCGVE
jgi:hypothetical protein